MAITKSTTAHEFLFRWDGSGRPQGAHIAFREAVIEDGVEITSRFLDPQPIALTDADKLAEIGASINAAVLADNTGKDAQIAQLTTGANEATQARDAALNQVQQLQEQLAALAPPPPINGVPQVVTRKQGRQALILAGKIDLVQPAIDAIADPVQRALMQSEWDDSPNFERQRPALNLLAQAMGLPPEAVDQLFITAATL